MSLFHVWRAHLFQTQRPFFLSFFFFLWTYLSLICCQTSIDETETSGKKLDKKYLGRAENLEKEEARMATEKDTNKKYK